MLSENSISKKYLTKSRFKLALEYPAKLYAACGGEYNPKGLKDTSRLDFQCLYKLRMVK